MGHLQDAVADLLGQDDPRVLRAWRAIFERDRNTAKYRAVFRKAEPLVTVCITTSDRAAVLAERALPTRLAASR